MRPLLVVEPKIIGQIHSGFTGRPVLMQINLFVLHRPPHALDENVVVDPAPGDAPLS